MAPDNFTLKADGVSLEVIGGGQPSRPIASVSLEGFNVACVFDEETMMDLTPAQRRQAHLGLQVVLLHLERTGLKARVKPCPM